MNEDFLDFLNALLGQGARFLVVGAHALAVHGVARATGDLDIWVGPGDDNVTRVWRALIEFGAPVEALGLDEGDLRQPGMVVQLGLPPRRIDLLTVLTGLGFEDAWSERVVREVSGLQLPFIGRRSFVANKRATGREKDLADLALLREAREVEEPPQ